MDQFRTFLVVLRRLHFWLICGLVMLLTVVFWFLSVSQLAKQKEQWAKQYEGAFSEASSLVSKPRIPNAKVAEAMGQLIEERRQEIAEAWREKYEQQNSEQAQILTWPVEEDFGPALVRKIGNLRPIEKELPFPLPQNDERNLNISLQEAYREYVFKELERLAKSIGASWTVAPPDVSGPGGIGEGRSGYGSARDFAIPGMGPMESLRTQDLVSWAPDNQQELIENHFDWSRDAGGGEGFGYARERSVVTTENPNPDTLEILYAQEDLWVLRALMKIIQSANAGAQSRFNAPVKEIEFVRIGKTAIPSAGRVTKVLSEEERAAQSQPGSLDSGPGRSEMTPEMGDASGYGQREPMGDSELMGGMRGPTLVDPAEGRYVDKDYQPLSAEKLRSVMSSTETIAPEDAYLAVAKRVPVRLRLSVDQRKLPLLLAACANAELTVEVRQVRLNPGDDGSLVSTSGYGMPGMTDLGGAPGVEGERRSPRMPGREGGYGAPGMPYDPLGGEPALDQFPYDVSAEIYGIVYIYNPVDKRALGIEDEAASTEEIDPGSVTMR